MASKSVSLILWHLGFAWRRTGWMLTLATAAFLLAAVFHWQTGWLLEEQAQLRQSLERLDVRPALLTTSEGGGDLRAQLAAFEASLPEPGDAASIVKKLFVLAERHGVQLAKGEYRANQDTAALLMRYLITLPVSGDANRIQAFMLDALVEIHQLGLDGIAFKRESTGNGNVEARLRFVLLMRMT